MTTDHKPLAADQLDDIEARANAATPGPWRAHDTHLGQYGYTATVLSGQGNDTDLRAWLPTMSQTPWDETRNAWADAAFVASARTDVPVLLAEVRRLRARTLTADEYSAAWHAVEGAAGEEGADPGTVLHAVLDRLGIAYPGAKEQPAEDAAERCGKCKQPFDRDDKRFDGRARYYLTAYCRGCVDRCHDTEIADHRCVICA